jgi:acyl-CoA synthetase (AMP-forming)/AMP-acid ligase II
MRKRTYQSRKWLCYLPMYHAMAQTIFIGGGPTRGIPVYIMQKFDFVKMLEAIQKFKITHLTMVPPIVVVGTISTVIFYILNADSNLPNHLSPRSTTSVALLTLPRAPLLLVVKLFRKREHYGLKVAAK